MQEAFTCAWGCSFEVGYPMVAGTYYQKWGRGEIEYVYLANSQVAFVGDDLVLTKKTNIKFWCTLRLLFKNIHALCL